MKLELKFIVSLIFAIIVSIFAIQNSASVDVNFFFWNFSISQALVIFLSAIIGGIIVLLLGLIKHIRSNVTIKKLTKEIDSIKKENEGLEHQVKELQIVEVEEALIDNEILENDIDHDGLNDDLEVLEETQDINELEI